MSTLAVVEQILRKATAPMSVREIVEVAGETLPTKSKTPDTVVARDLSMDIKKKGEDSLFVRTAPGRYAVREVWERQQAERRAAETSTRPPSDGHATPVLSKAMSEERAGTRPATVPPTAAESTASESSANQS